MMCPDWSLTGKDLALTVEMRTRVDRRRGLSIDMIRSLLDHLALGWRSADPMLARVKMWGLHFVWDGIKGALVKNPCCHAGPAALSTQPLRGTAAQELNQ
jgi:hypothetical protein